MNKGIIVIIGGDGCGKSTLIDRLKAKGYPTSTWKDIGKCIDHTQVSEGLRSYVRLLTTTRLFPDLGPLSRFSLTLSLLFAEYEFCISPALKKWGYIIVDSFYLKLLAREIVKHSQWPMLINVNDFLPKPDLVILLVVPPEIGFERSFRRKAFISEYEVRESPTKEDFVAFQQDVLEECRRLIGQIPIITIDGTLAAEEVCENVCAHLPSKPSLIMEEL